MSGIGLRFEARFSRALVRAALFGCIVMGQFAAPASAAERDLNARVIQSGHSLTDPIPPILKRMVNWAGGKDARIALSSTPGSPMEWRWEHPTARPDARLDIAEYEVMVQTERVPLSNTLPWHSSEKFALQWFNHAWTKGNDGKGAQTILYATWVDIDSGPNSSNPYNDPEGNIPWRERLPLEIARWEQIADYVNANRPAGSPVMPVIPGTQIMAAIYDGIADGSAPVLKDISDLFDDNIHINDIGAYAISLAHYAVIYGRDPRGVPADVGQPNPPSQELARWLQDIVWKTVTEYERSGVGPS